MKKIGFQKLIFRIFQSAFAHTVKFLMSKGCPGLKICSFTEISQVFLHQRYPVLFFQKIQVHGTLSSSGCKNVIYQFLVWGFYNDLAVLIPFSQFFLAYHIVYFTGTSDKILFCDHMLACLQKIPVYLNICPQVSPSAPVDIKRFLNRFTDIIKTGLFSVQTQCHLFLGTGCDQKFLQMLIGHRLL